jgi:hypothetical protein
MSHQLRLIAHPRALGIAQELVEANHYLRKAVDGRSRPYAYLVVGEWTSTVLGCLIFGRPEATRCYEGNLTYGSQADVDRERASYDRWSVLNLARVWLHPAVQRGGRWCRPELVPGFTDRKGSWRPRAASWAIEEALATVGYDYLKAHPPVWVDNPYQIEVALSYCDTTKHRGTIYRAAGWALARRNERGIETWFTPAVCPLSAYEDDQIRKLAAQSERSRRLRAREIRADQMGMTL